MPSLRDPGSFPLVAPCYVFGALSVVLLEGQRNIEIAHQV